VLVSLASLATGTRTSPIRNGLRRGVSITAYPFLRALKGIEQGVGYATGLVFSYHDARNEADEMQRRLADAMQQAAERNELVRENARLRRMMDFARGEPGLTLEPVNVIDSFKGIITIDRGSLHGIEESMCALSDGGIVGTVTQVNLASANVATLHNGDCKVGAMIARNRVRGTVHGSSGDLSRYCTMTYIDMKDEVRVGDTVVTSPESMFPAGRLVGRVIAVHDEPGSLWQYADVEPAADPYRLDELFIVRRAVTPLAELPPARRENVRLSVASEVPDTRSIQERYAP